MNFKLHGNCKNEEFSFEIYFLFYCATSRILIIFVVVHTENLRLFCALVRMYQYDIFVIHLSFVIKKL